MKRQALFSILKSYRSAVVCLQEMHFQTNTLSMLKKYGYQVQFHSTHTAYSRGVSVLISNDVSFTLLQSQIDDQLRYIFLLCKLDGLLCIVANIYVPPPFSLDCLNCLAQFMAPYTNIAIWVMGDFNNLNNLLDRILDKFSPYSGYAADTRGSTPFARLISKIGLGDVWRDRYPDRKCYSCYSATHRALSHIKFCNSLAMPKVSLVEYVPRSISDHSLLRALISVPGTPGERLWKVNPFWLQLFPTNDPNPRALTTFLQFNKGTD